MHPKKALALTAVVTILSIPTFGQISGEILSTHSDSLHLNLNRERIGKEGTGNYTVVVQDTLSRQLFNGLHVSNTLRGHVPNLGIGSSINSSVSGLRNENPMFIIDGIPFRHSIASYYNFNTFNFETVAAVSSANALSLYGGLGSGGGILLESKTGKGKHKAQFEANSTTTFAMLDERKGLPFAVAESENQLMFSHAVAYAQDYGKVDTRVSYINSYLPDASSSGESVGGGHAVKLNTGFEFSPRLSARVVADVFSKVDRFFSDGDVYSDRDNIYRSLAGNIFLNYQASGWLTLSSQSNFIKSTFDFDVRSDYSTGSFDDDEHRALTNVMATFHPKLSPVVALTFVTGAQLERQIAEQESLYNSQYASSGSWMKAKGKTRAWISHVSFQSWRYLTVNLNYRYDYWVDTPDNRNDPSTYSVDAAFRFKDALGLQNTWLVNGILRGSVGKTNSVETVGYPYASFFTITVQPAFQPGGGFVSPYLEPTQRRSSEIGADLYFLDSRLSIQSTYFYHVNSQTLAFVPFPYAGNGVAYVLSDIGKNEANGFETVLGYDFYKRNNTLLSAKAIYAGYKFRFDPKDETFIDLTEQNSTIPKWTGSLLIRFRASRLFGQLLCTHQSGGEYTLFSYPAQRTQIDFTQTWLRDIAVGYTFSKISLSLAGRNLLELYAKRNDHEAYENSRIQKGVTLSASFRF